MPSPTLSWPVLPGAERRDIRSVSKHVLHRKFTAFAGRLLPSPTQALFKSINYAAAASIRNVTDPAPRHFIHEKIAADAAAGVPVRTRFPPEPNGHLHIGHVKAIWLNFEMARRFGGDCTLRYDDTNPETESTEFECSILEGIRWLGYGEDLPVRHASSYFEQLHDFAVQLIRSGRAYICDLPLDEMRRQRGDFNTPGTDSPYRTRTVEENLERFAQMRSGELPDGACSLRARIDMQSPNLYLRDPVLYRIRHARHHRTGDAWCIYPTYDFAHGLSDVIEGVSHSLCTLEFEEHRPLYDFLVDAIELPHGTQVRPRQTEFSRLQLDYTVTSKRKLAELIRLGVVEGWDDPRMPTLAGMQRRGYPPEAILDLCQRVGVTRQEAWTDLGLLETCVRDALSGVERAMAVLRPLRVVLTNLPEDFEQSIQAQRHPQDESLGVRDLLLRREIYIEQSDFALDAPKGYFRLRPEGEVRLRHAGVIRHTGHDCRADGSVETVYCEFLGEVDHKVKGVVHWVPTHCAVPTTVRLYDRLFAVQKPADVELSEALNPDSLEVIDGAMLEPALAGCGVTTVQFERLGYFCTDAWGDANGNGNGNAPGDEGGDNNPPHSLWNRTVTLRDTWAKRQQS